MTMTRRRNSINIYDYPEHLNPFREDVDADDCDKFNTTGRRRSSFRAMFSGNKGKSKTSEDINPHSQSAASRFMTWTPKLLRRSFRRSSPSRTTSQLDRPSQNSSQISFRSSTSRTSLPPSGSSHSSLHSSRSRSMLPPSSSPPHSLPPRPMSPPYRPAPPNFRQQLPPSQQSTENVNSDTTPVPPRRRALYSAASPGTSAGEMPTEDEVKYLQQGAKPKKKRRAPLPPGPPPSKTPGDTRQVNSNQESEASLTSSVTSSSVEEPTSHEQSVPASPELKVTVQESETQPQKEEPESKLPENNENETPENTEISASKDSPPEQQNGVLEETPKLENNISDSQESSNTNKDETDAQEQLVTQTDKDVTEVQKEEKKMEENETEENKMEGKKTEEKKMEQNETEEKKIETDETEENKMEDQKTDENKMQEKPINGIDHRKVSLENLKVDFDIVLHISEEDLRDKDPPIQNGNHSGSDVNHNVEHLHENGVTEMDDSVKSNSHVKEEEKELKLHNGLNETDHSESETKLNDVNKKRSPMKTPEPKPRTILPISKDM